MSREPCCNQDCTQGKFCPLRQAMQAPIQREGGQQIEHGLPITMFEANHPWDWIDRTMTALQQYALYVAAFCDECTGQIENDQIQQQSDQAYRSRQAMPEYWPVAELDALTIRRVA